MKLKRAGALIMSAALVAGACAGCQKPADTTSSTAATSSAATATVPDYMNPVGQYPITKEKITVTAMCATNSDMASNWNDLKAFKRLEEKTNIHFDFQGVNSKTYRDQMSIKMAGSDFPEVLLMGGMGSLDEESYGPAGKWKDLTDLINNYAPNLKNLRETNQVVKLGNTAMDGKIYALPNYTESSANVPSLSFFNETWMKNVGVTKVPETTDEFYALLKAFKEKDANGNGDPNDEIPFSCQGSGYMRVYLQTAFQGLAGGSVADNWDVTDDGKVVWLPLEKGYKEFLTFCNKMYKEGLLDPEYATQTSDQLTAKVKANKVGFYNSTPTIFVGTDVEKNKEKQICLPPLTSPTNSKKVSQAPNYFSTTNGVITSNCKHPEAVMRWFDMFYIPEGQEVDNFCGKTSLLGYQNEEWKYTDSSKTKYEFIDPIKSYKELNQQIIITYGLPAYISNTAMQVSSDLMAQKLEAAKTNQVPYYRQAYPNGVRFTKDEADTDSLYITDLDNYQMLMENKFITGEESLDKFDAFVNTVKSSYNIDKLIQLRQTAYDRYISHK